MHISVLSAEVIDYFSDCQCPIFVDGTLGAGGHSLAILENHPEIKTLIGIDQDPDALEIARQRLQAWQGKTSFVKGNFTNLRSYLNALGIHQVNGILLDLGVSSMQLDRPEKGFSFMKEGPLDMRMDPTAPLNAKEIINTWPEKELGRIFRDYGEEKQWRSAARAVVEARKKGEILTTTQLADILKPVLAWKFSKGINPFTLVFQGLRICVNNELGVLEKVLPEAIDLLAPGGRLAVITFHSLEDRLVKNAFRFAASDKYDTAGIGGMFLDKDPVAKLLMKRPIEASEKEIKDNPRSRSAKLRVLEKL